MRLRERLLIWLGLWEIRVHRTPHVIDTRRRCVLCGGRFPPDGSGPSGWCQETTATGPRRRL